MKKSILFIAGLAIGTVLHAQTQSDSTRVKTPDSQLAEVVNKSDESSFATRASYSSIKDLEYESWDSYYSLVSNEFSQREQFSTTPQPINRKTQREKIKAARKD